MYKWTHKLTLTRSVLTQLFMFEGILTCLKSIITTPSNTRQYLSLPALHVLQCHILKLDIHSWVHLTWLILTCISLLVVLTYTWHIQNMTLRQVKRLTENISWCCQIALSFNKNKNCSSPYNCGMLQYKGKMMHKWAPYHSCKSLLKMSKNIQFSTKQIRNRKAKGT